MRNIFYFAAFLIVLSSCKDADQSKTETVVNPQKDTTTRTLKVNEVISFKGQQVTGVSVANDGRVFVNFVD